MSDLAVQLLLALAGVVVVLAIAIIPAWIDW